MSLTSSNRSCHDSGDALRPVSTEARRIGIHPRQLRRAIKRGELRAFHVGSWLRLRKRDVEAWIETRRYQPEDRSGVSERPESERDLGRAEDR